MTISPPTKLRVIDSHTAGEPTRLVIEGAPDFEGDMATVRQVLSDQADWIRTSLTLEPRGAPWMVGGLLVAPTDPRSAAGVVFFNNVGYLGMCGHGLIGLVATLAHMGRIQVGVHAIETPVGVVDATLHQDGSVSFENVVCHRSQHQVTVQVPGLGPVTGDIAYGGNWFFLANDPELPGRSLAELSDRAQRIMLALRDQAITGDRSAEIDHVELFGPPTEPAIANSRSFVLCPGGQYDRSPCGTGTSAKLACLAAEGRLKPGETWTQQSITGGLFQANYRETKAGIVPTIRGQAFVNAEVLVTFDPSDPLRHGFLPDSPT